LPNRPNEPGRQLGQLVGGEVFLANLDEIDAGGGPSDGP
jgi:hypothetical protein